MGALERDEEFNVKGLGLGEEARFVKGLSYWLKNLNPNLLTLNQTGFLVFT
jgi:hypothetical protein